MLRTALAMNSEDFSRFFDVIVLRRMNYERDDSGNWTIHLTPEEQEEVKRSGTECYQEAFQRYLTLLDGAFRKAKEVSEHAFVQTLMAFRGMHGPGWNPFETSLSALPAIRRLRSETTNAVAQMHLELWLYGHIVEASEPYEMLGNFLGIMVGETYHTDRFLGGRNDRPPSPEVKVRALEAMAQRAGLPSVVEPQREILDSALRNAIFHSDYALWRGEIRFRKTVRRQREPPLKNLPAVYTADEWHVLVNRANACFEAFRFLRQFYIRSYTEPVAIEMHPLNASFPGEKAIVMVREGHGAIGLKHAWTKEEIIQGRIPWRIARYSYEEMRLADADPTRALFPARCDQSPGD